MPFLHLRRSISPNQFSFQLKIFKTTPYITSNNLNLFLLTHLSMHILQEPFHQVVGRMASLSIFPSSLRLRFQMHRQRPSPLLLNLMFCLNKTGMQETIPQLVIPWELLEPTECKLRMDISWVTLK